MQIGYVALRKLSPPSDNKGQKFVQASLREHFKEIVSLDSMLCPSVIQTLIEEDKGHRVHEFLAHDFFSDLSYLMRRVKGESQIEILAILPDPSLTDIHQFQDPAFEFLGFELVDVESRVDPLLNCSTFQGLLSVDSFTNTGLIRDYTKAKQIQKELVDNYPNHVHVNTILFAIWRKRE